MTRIEALRSAINALVERSNALRASLQEYATRDGDPSEEERTQFAADVAEFEETGPKLEGMRGELAQLEQIANAPEQARETAAAPAVVTRTTEDPFARGREFGQPLEVRDAALRAVEQVTGLTDDHRGSAERLLRERDTARGDLARHILVTGRAAYRSAFAKFMAGVPEVMNDEERQAVMEARVGSLSDAAGGYAVPFVIDPTVIDTGTHLGVGNPWRALANVISVVGDNWQGVSSAGVTASMVGEATEATDGTPTFAQPAITVKKAQAFVPFTMEIGMDYPGFEGEIRRMFGIAKEELEDLQFTLGSGSGNNVNGLVTDLVAAGGSVVVASATANDITTLADTFAMENALAPRFRSGASWLSTRTIYNKWRAIDTAANTTNWERLGPGLPAQLVGYPMYEAQNMDSTYGSGENYVAILGDIRQAYNIIDRVGMSIELIPHLFGTGNNYPNGTRGLYMSWRFGAKTVNTTAARILNIT